jgi:uncharacterized membrane protein
MKNINKMSEQLFGKSFDELDRQTQKVTRHLAERKTISRLPLQAAPDPESFGSKAADTVASFGGSWTFIVLFCSILLIWIVLNTMILSRINQVFDPYPFILLNLFLSMTAAIQAPIILMSQNRQAAKDRVSAEHDYEVNLKAELEIMTLHEKIDLLRDKQWSDLIEIQAQQLALLKSLLSSK